jgi:hypothetical protein
MRTLFRDGRIFDGSGAGAASGDVVVERDCIVDVGVGLDGDVAVDCTGQTVLPGCLIVTFTSCSAGTWISSQLGCSCIGSWLPHHRVGSAWRVSAPSTVRASRMAATSWVRM